VLDSPAAPDGPDPFARPTFAAIRRVAASACVRSCRFTHDTLGELTELLRRLARRPLHARAFDGHGRAHAVVIRAAQVRDVLLATDLSLVARAMWPAAVHAALAGDSAPLARLVRATAHAAPLRLPGGALRVARMCGGRVAARSEGGVSAALTDAFAPFTPQLAAAVSPAAICARWPEPPSAEPLATPVGIPMLVRSGEGSLTTPLEDAQALAARVPGAQLLALPLFGHAILSLSFGPIGDCPLDALRAFAQEQPVQPCRRPGTSFAWPFAPPRSLAAVSPRPGVPGRVGRTLHAAQLTLLDAVFSLSDTFFAIFGSDPVPGIAELANGGLRGGSVRFTRDALVLRHYGYIPGVILTGAYGDSGWLRISGDAAVHGRLRLAENACGERACFVGRLGNRSVHLLVPGSG
jgi:hypothetical protein